MKTAIDGAHDASVGLLLSLAKKLTPEETLQNLPRQLLMLYVPCRNAEDFAVFSFSINVFVVCPWDAFQLLAMPLV